MLEPEEELQSAGKEEKRKNKKGKVKIEQTDGDAAPAVESAREGLRDAMEAGLGLIGENDDEKKRGKKKRCRDVEATERHEGTSGKSSDEGIKLAEINVEKDEKVKKKKRKKDKVDIGKEGGISPVTSVSAGDVDERINIVSKDKKARTDKGKHGVRARKIEEVVEEGVEVQEIENRKKKGKSAGAVNNLESVGAGILENMSENQERRRESGMQVRLREDHVHDKSHDDRESLKETDKKRKKRDRNSKNTKFISENHDTQEGDNQQKPITEDEMISRESSSHAPCDNKKRKKDVEVENSLQSGELKKKKNKKKKEKKNKKAKDKIIGHVKPILNSMSGRELDTTKAEETVEDVNHKMQSASVSRHEEKTKRKRKNKDETTQNLKGIPTMDVRETTKVSAHDGTSGVRNVDNANASTTAETKTKKKKVNFSGHVEVFPSTDDADGNEKSNEDGLVLGKRFSPEEDEMIKQAVFDYIRENQLGEDGLNMVLKCKSHPEARNCWKEIGAALPWRPRSSIYYRAHTLFQRSETRKWAAEELDLVRRYYNEHGPKWKEMGDLLGKHRVHVKDAWRRIKLPNAKKGQWSQEEYQALFDLVNVDLQLKAFEEKKTKYGMIRENISWGAISDKLSTRSDANCCVKWYKQLTSPLVTQGLWADADDYRLIDELLKLDAYCIEDVKWDSLLENRSGDICLNRWKQMSKHIGGHREKSFTEQVELLATRYCPNMLKYRTQNLEKSEEKVNETGKFS